MSDEREIVDGIERTDAATLAQLQADFMGMQGGAAASEPGEPLEPERIWDAVHGRLGEAERVAIIDRLHRDPELACEWRLALALREDAGELATAGPEPELAPAESESESESEPEPEPATAPASAPANDRAYWYAGALALVAAAVVVIVVRDPNPSGDPPGDPLRAPLEDPGGASLRAAEGEAAIASELDDAALAPSDFELRWTPVPGALRYELQLTTRALDAVWAADDLTDNHATVPAEALEPLAAGTELIWRVTAVMPDGQRRSSAALRVTRE